MFWKLSKLQKPLGECNLNQFCAIFSTKLPLTNQNAVTVSFEILWSNVGNLRNTSVEPRTSSKFFGSTSEIFGGLRVNFGNPRKCLVSLPKSSLDFGSTSEVLGSTTGIFGLNLESFGKLRINFGSLPMLCGRLPKSLEDFVNFGKLHVNFRKNNWYPWRVQFGINCTPLIQSENLLFCWMYCQLVVEFWKKKYSSCKLGRYRIKQVCTHCFSWARWKKNVLNVSLSQESVLRQTKSRNIAHRLIYLKLIKHFKVISLLLKRLIPRTDSPVVEIRFFHSRHINMNFFSCFQKVISSVIPTHFNSASFTKELTKNKSSML